MESVIANLERDLKFAKNANREARQFGDREESQYFNGYAEALSLAIDMIRQNIMQQVYPV